MIFDIFKTTWITRSRMTYSLQKMFKSQQFYIINKLILEWLPLMHRKIFWGLQNNHSLREYPCRSFRWHLNSVESWEMKVSCPFLHVHYEHPEWVDSRWPSQMTAWCVCKGPRRYFFRTTCIGSKPDYEQLLRHENSLGKLQVKHTSSISCPSILCRCWSWPTWGV